MRSAVLIALFAIGCGGSLDQSTAIASDSAADAMPLTCGPITGRYSWTWTKRSGSCVMPDRVTEAPAFDCGAEPMRSTAAGDRCDLAGDITCANGTVTLVCSTTDYATIVCDAQVTQTDCSGEYTLTMKRAG